MLVKSPVMFSLFVEDLELFLQDRENFGLNLHDVCLILLLFDDYMVLLSETKEELQLSLDKLVEYCDKRGLEVNVAKTKIVVFRKRGHVRNDEQWLKWKL